MFTVFLICLVIFLVIATLIVVALIKSHSSDGKLPKQDFGSHHLQRAWAVPPVVIVLVLGLMSSKLILSITASPAQAVADTGNADLVVVGHQWWWEVRYPESGAVTANEIHIPLKHRLRIRLDSADVIHSFWCPQVGPKMDMVPGHPNFIWLEADRPGRYDGACSEFCGDQHAWMRFTVIVEDEAKYQAWLDRQVKPERRPESALAQAGQNYFLAQTCINCHAIRGTGGVADAGPDLTHLADRSLLAGGAIPNTHEDLARWLRDPQQVKPGCKMPDFNLNDDQVKQLAAYLEGTR
jgi:cytochrome c oxidase subunit 2